MMNLKFMKVMLLKRSGQTQAEYAITIFIVALASMVALAMIGDAVRKLLSGLTSAL